MALRVGYNQGTQCNGQGARRGPFNSLATVRQSLAGLVHPVPPRLLVELVDGSSGRPASVDGLNNSSRTADETSDGGERSQNSLHEWLQIHLGIMGKKRPKHENNEP